MTEKWPPMDSELISWWGLKQGTTVHIQGKVVFNPKAVEEIISCYLEWGKHL